jgi:signal transduction histidine kinase
MVSAAEAKGVDLGDARVATETVARRAEGISRFVESYREFAQAPEVHRKTFQAQPWAEEILRLATASIGDRELETRLDVNPAALKMSADPELLAQALINLLRNAIRATADVERPMVRLVIHRQPRGQIRIEIRDNGPGIPMARRDDIFLPFYTTHKGGSGVGLSFARQVALAHGGSISAADAPEGGANLIMLI